MSVDITGHFDTMIEYVFLQVMFLKMVQKNFYSRYCNVDLLSLLRDPRALYEYLHFISPVRPLSLLSFFSLSVACSLSSFYIERKCATETSSKLTVTYANSQAHKIYLLGPNILHALVLQSPILLILLINVSGYERSNLSERRYSVRRLFRCRYAYDYKWG